MVRAGRTVATAGLVAVVALGCHEGRVVETDGRAAAGPDAVRRVADALVDAGSSRVSTSMEMVSGGTRITIDGDGDFDYVKGVGELRIKIPEDDVHGGHGVITELFAPGVLYMKNRGEGVPPGKWVRFDTTRLADGNLVTGGATDPLTAAELLRGAVGVTLVGEEILDGVPVTHYRGTTDIERAARSAAPPSQEVLRAAARGFAVTEVPFDAYLDGQGRPREVRQRFTFSDSAGEGTVVVVSVTGMYGFGEPVEVVLPPEHGIYTGKIVSSAADRSP